MQAKPTNLLALLVNKLVSNGVIKSKEVSDTMLVIDRGEFCEHDAYKDSPQKIGYNATISAPHMHAYALVMCLFIWKELLKDHLIKAERVLDVGSGSGYLAIAMFKMMKSPTAMVVGIEHIPELVELSKINLNKFNYL